MQLRIMQLSGILVFAVAVATGFAVPLNQDDDRMKELISAVSDFFSAQSAKLKPVKLPNIHQDTSKIPIIGGLISANTYLTNSTYYGFNETAIENIRTNPGQLVGQMSFRHPKLVVSGKYKLQGTVLGFDVAEGEGDYSLEYINMTTTLSNIRLVETKTKALRVKSLGISLELDDDKFEVTGLNIQGLSVSNFEKIAELVLHKMFNVNKRPTAVAWEIATVRRMNQLIGNRTLEQVVEYLEKHKDADFHHNDEHHQKILAQFFKV